MKSFQKCPQEYGYDRQKFVPEASVETNQQDKHKSEWARCYQRSQIFNLKDNGTFVRGYRNLKSSLSVCMSVCVLSVPCVCITCRVQKRVLDPSGLQFQTVVAAMCRFWKPSANPLGEQ